MLYTLMIVLVLIWAVFHWKNRKFNKVAKDLKHDLLSLPILGLAYMFLGSDEDRMKAIQKLGKETIKQGGLMSGWMVNRFFVFVADAESGEFIWKNCLEKDDLMNPMKLFLGNATLVAPVHLWRPRRKILMPAFNIHNLNQYLSLFDKESKVLVEYLRPTVGNTVSIYDYLTKYSMETICQSALGIKLDMLNHNKGKFLELIEFASKVSSRRVLQPWLQSDFIYSLLPEYKYFLKHINFARKSMGQALEIIRQKNKDENDHKLQRNEKNHLLCYQLFEAVDEGQWYDEKAVIDEAMLLFAAGTETSAIAVSYTALMLARHPDAQEKIYKELLEVFGDSEKCLEPDDLLRLTYTDAVIKETIRLYPPAPILFRKTDKDIQLPNGVSLPAGCGLLMHVWAMNRNPRYWGADADEFRPERFLAALPHPAQFVTFSFGPRNCIGYTYAMMSMKTVLATLLRQYRILPAPETHPSIPLKTTYEVMMKESSNFSIILKMRTECKS